MRLICSILAAYCLVACNRYPIDIFPDNVLYGELLKCAQQSDASLYCQAATKSRTEFFSAIQFKDDASLVVVSNVGMTAYLQSIGLTQEQFLADNSGRSAFFANHFVRSKISTNTQGSFTTTSGKTVQVQGGAGSQTLNTIPVAAIVALPDVQGNTLVKVNQALFTQ